MSDPLITPVWREAPVQVQRWMERVTKILTGRIEGGVPVVASSTEVSAVASTAAGIIAGTIPLMDVVVVGYGSLPGIDSAQETNIAAATGAAGGGGGLTAIASPSSMYETGDEGTPFSSSPVTVTPSGGTPGYTGSWTRISGSTAIDAASPSSLTTAFVVAILPAGGLTRSARFRCTVTDGAAATYFVDFAVTVYSNPTGIPP